MSSARNKPCQMTTLAAGPLVRVERCLDCGTITLHLGQRGRWIEQQRIRAVSAEPRAARRFVLIRKRQRTGCEARGLASGAVASDARAGHRGAALTRWSAAHSRTPRSCVGTAAKRASGYARGSVR